MRETEQISIIYEDRKEDGKRLSKTDRPTEQPQLTLLRIKKGKIFGEMHTAQDRISLLTQN